MGYKGPQLIAWERALQDVFDRVDVLLEERHGRRFPRRRNRPPHGSPAAPQYDGLFNIGAAFSQGIGSRHGPGYVVELRVATTATIPPEVRSALEDEAAEMLRAELPRVFPDRQLEVTRDGPVYKIHGDLGLSGRSRSGSE